MQTFMPLACFVCSLQALDRQRLGKQRVEAQQILNALQNGGGWANHPAVKMWQGYTPALTQYRNLAILIWMQHGYNNNMPMLDVGDAEITYPPWFGSSSFHISHQSNLIRKDSAHYGPMWPQVPNDLPYEWPSTPHRHTEENNTTNGDQHMPLQVPKLWSQREARESRSTRTKRLVPAVQEAVNAARTELDKLNRFGFSEDRLAKCGCGLCRGITSDDILRVLSIEEQKIITRPTIILEDVTW